MKKEKVVKDNKPAEIKPVVDNFYKFKNARMVRISGNFMGGGFGLSQNKAKAIIENYQEIKMFAEGKYDTEIDELQEDEILKF